MMKKILYSLCALFVCFMMASCGNPTEKLRSLVDDISQNGNDWTDEEQWESVGEDAVNCLLDFVETDPTAEDCEEFMEAWEEFGKSWEDVDERAARKAQKRGDKTISKQYKKKVNKALDKIKKIIREEGEDED